MRVATAHLGADAGEELGELERLGDVVHGAGVEADHDVELVIARCEHHDVHVGVVLVDASTDLEPVAVRKPEVEEYEVGSQLARS